MQVCVKLPSDPLLEFWHFCNAIAEALCPLAKQQAGIECVIGKRVTREVSLAASTDQRERWPLHMGLQRVLLSDDDRTLDEMLRDAAEVADAVAERPLEVAPRREVVEVPSIVDLDDEDRLAFEELLLDYPTLRPLLSSQNEEAFLSAYHDILKRPSWVPVFRTAADIKRREREQDDVRDHHRRALQTEFAEGRVAAVDGRNAPIPVLTTGSFIPRAQALAYLDRCGLAYGDDVTDAKARGNKHTKQLKRKVASATMPSPDNSIQNVGAPPQSLAAPIAGMPDTPKQPVSEVPEQPLDARSQRRGKVARLKRVCELTGLGRSSIYNRMDPRSPYYDATFPRSFSLSTTGNGAIGWNEEEVQAWVASQAAS
ncbi:helix-turn-helix transcriptional regulator [Burkholderia vietnamiensis]|uniref:helix-turn-helix transcriptional regulator n=1 Tax=Burkholderia vietnamiensis TaxID=60552 RepID=UPI00264A9A4F|nr:AlpA family phage regulatory protein [Burkholderia vietnamiensis]MDN8036985.1 AlpA family phage regulatory protein [Burkholderia vietnamiensis]